MSYIERAKTTQCKSGELTYHTRWEDEQTEEKLGNWLMEGKGTNQLINWL